MTRAGCGYETKSEEVARQRTAMRRQSKDLESIGKALSSIVTVKQ